VKTKQQKLNDAYEHLRSLGKFFTKKDFAKQIDFDRTNLSSAFSGSERYLTEGLFKKICDTYPEIFDVDYFLKDDREMLKSEAVNPGTKKQSAKNAIQLSSKSVDSLIFVPLLPISAQAGTLDDFVVSVKDSDCERVIAPIKGVDFALTVAGDSMAPEYPSGSQILVKKINERAFIDWGRVYVLDTCNGIVIKRIFPSDDPNRFKCVSINSEDPPFDVSCEDIFGVYRVLMCWSVK
jgi:hypothetical protein